MHTEPIAPVHFCQSRTPMVYVGPHEGQRLRFLHTHVNPLPEFPALTHVQDVYCQPEHLVPPHIHATYEITYVVSGKGHWMVEGQRLDVGAGDCWVVHPGELHTGGADPDDPYHIYVLGIDPAALLRADARTQNTWQNQRQRVRALSEQGALLLNAPAGDWLPAGSVAPPYDFGALEQRCLRVSTEVGTLFPRILQELDDATRTVPGSTDRRLGVLMVQALLVELFVVLARSRQSPRPGLPGRFELLDRWLRASLGAPPTVPEMARFCGLSTAHFATEFKRETGCTPHGHMLHLRLEEAGRRLRQDDELSITRVALDLGFSSPQYFSVAFKSHHGCTPGEWRQKPDG